MFINHMLDFLMGSSNVNSIAKRVFKKY